MLPTRDTLLFRIDALPGSTLAEQRDGREDLISSEALNALRRRVVALYGMDRQDGVWLTMSLDNPGVRGFAAELKSLRESKQAIVGWAQVSQKVRDIGGAEWFAFKPRFDVPRWGRGPEDYPACDCGSIDPEAMVAGHQTPLFSQPIVEFVRKHGLSGVDFVEVLHCGRFEATRWYLPVSLEWMGRGADHPWFRSGVPDPDYRRDPEWRSAIRRVSPSNFGSVRPYAGTAASELLELIPPENWNILGPLRLRREDLPATSFGYVVARQSCQPPHGHEGHVRTLCFDASVHRQLTAAGLLHADDCEAIEIVEGAEPITDTAQFAAVGEFITREWERLKRSESSVIGSARNKPPRCIDLGEVLERLRHGRTRVPSAKSSPPEPTDGVWEEIRAAIGIDVPAEWRKVLQAKWSCATGEAWAFSAESLVESHRSCESCLLEGSEDAGKYLHVATEACGDWFSVPINGSRGVVQFDHESGAIKRRWTGIAEFVEEMLIPAPKE